MRSLLFATAVCCVSPLMGQQNTPPPLPEAPGAPKAQAPASQEEEPAVLEWDTSRIYRQDVNWEDGMPLKEKSRVETGETVKKGAPLMELSQKELQEAIEAAEEDAASKRLDVDNNTFAWEQGQRAGKRNIENAERNVARLTEDWNDYETRFLPRQERENEFALKRAESNLLYKKENLRQLERMYKEDQITEESEEIILTRTRNEVADAEEYLNGARITFDWNKTRKFPREKADKQRALEEARTALDVLKKQVEIELAGKELALKKTRRLLRLSEDKLAALKKEQEELAGALAAPADGVLVWLRPSDSKSGLALQFMILPEDMTLMAELKEGPAPEAGKVLPAPRFSFKGKKETLPPAEVKSVEGNKVTVSFEKYIKDKKTMAK